MPNSQFELIWYATMNITNQCIDLHRKHPNLFRNQIIALNALLIKIWSYRIIHSNIANWHIVFFKVHFIFIMIRICFYVAPFSNFYINFYTNFIIFRNCKFLLKHIILNIIILMKNILDNEIKSIMIHIQLLLFYYAMKCEENKFCSCNLYITTRVLIP